jgi:hypothetical protein
VEEGVVLLLLVFVRMTLAEQMLLLLLRLVRLVLLLWVLLRLTIQIMMMMITSLMMMMMILELFHPVPSPLSQPGDTPKQPSVPFTRHSEGQREVLETDLGRMEGGVRNDSIHHLHHLFFVEFFG